MFQFAWNAMSRRRDAWAARPERSHTEEDHVEQSAARRDRICPCRDDRAAGLTAAPAQASGGTLQIGEHQNLQGKIWLHYDNTPNL
ncbi:hypothetical protein Acor_07380 [Acrocarpospora corrugata]|uniref:Uncharacterized protein n=1 Tax=Acrocarpospora corrugata TaxID=35763 RepID=A0A5M3VPG2_9ACTN|nr:hypothetical protein [Acrocarpospora corrugata]GER98676.1 hypothetical protein Acor_07380 [Acrocarpospora corrugata]